MASISQERFLQFAELALAAFNSKNEAIKLLTEQVADLTSKLEVALGNDKADADTIAAAQADAEKAKSDLADSTAKANKESEELIAAISALETELGIVVPVPSPEPEPIPTV